MRTRSVLRWRLGDRVRLRGSNFLASPLSKAHRTAHGADGESA
jgi:hypothetical protein